MAKKKVTKLDEHRAKVAAAKASKIKDNDLYLKLIKDIEYGSTPFGMEPLTRVQGGIEENSFFLNPGFFHRNPPPGHHRPDWENGDRDAITKDVTPDQVKWMHREFNEWKDQQSFDFKKPGDYFDLSPVHRLYVYEKFLVSPWADQLSAYQTITLLGFAQDYKKTWSKEDAERHEDEILDSRTVWGGLWDDSLIPGDIVEAAETAEQDHADYIHLVPDTRQTNLFDKQNRAAYKPPPSREKLPKKQARKEKTFFKKARKTKGGPTVSTGASIDALKKASSASSKPAKKLKKARDDAKMVSRVSSPKHKKTPIDGEKIGVDRKSTPKHPAKNKKAFTFLGWVLEFTVFDLDAETAIRWSWRDSEALAMLTDNTKSLFITRMIENLDEPESAPKTVKRVKKLFETWSKKRARLQWSATVEEIPEIDPKWEPMSIKYWSDKYKDDPMGQVYFHEFEADSGIKAGFNLAKNFPKVKPIAIKVTGCKITHRGIE